MKSTHTGSDESGVQGDPPERTRGERRFHTTQWSVVLSAGQGGTEKARAALESLCSTYWYPLYAFVRQRAADGETARDLTQAFFVHLLENNALAVADPQRGRFRSFLLTSLKNFLANEHARNTAAKRGGDVRIVSLDVTEGESRLRLEPARGATPDQEFERRWTLTLLDRVVKHLEETQAGSPERQARFAVLKPYLTQPATDYADAAERLDMTPAAVKQAVYRLRQEYRRILREEVARTVESPDEVDAEIRRLLAGLRPDAAS